MTLKPAQTTVLLAATALAAAAPPLASAADFTVTPTVTNDYDFRGISLSARDPALQISFDVTTESGFKAYAWASNTDIGVDGVDAELDLSLGWAGGGDKLSWDAGVVWYTYLGGSELNYPEAWVGASRAVSAAFNVSGKVWYSWDYANLSDSAYYLDLNASYALPVADIGLTLHAGYSGGKYWDNLNNGGYTDFSVGLTKSVGNLNFALKFIDGSDLPDTGSRINSTDQKVVLSLSTTLPWQNTGASP